MENNPTGIVVQFPHKGPNNAVISVKTQSVSALNEAFKAVLGSTPTMANANGLGDLESFHRKEKLSWHVRTDAARYVSDMHQSIVETYQDELSRDAERLVFTNLVHAFVTRLRNYSQVRVMQGASDFEELYHALDNAVEHSANLIYALDKPTTPGSAA